MNPQDLNDIFLKEVREIAQPKIDANMKLQGPRNYFIGSGFIIPESFKAKWALNKTIHFWFEIRNGEVKLEFFTNGAMIWPKADKTMLETLQEICHGE